MLSVHMQVELKASPDEVWKLIGGFNDLPDWLPPIEKSTLDETGKIRHLSLAGGGEIVEQLEEHNDQERYYRYSIINSPLPPVQLRSYSPCKRSGRRGPLDCGLVQPL